MAVIASMPVTPLILKGAFYQPSECMVCEEPYEDQDIEVELPCNKEGNHTMHEVCATRWTEYFSKCPRCK